MFTGIIEAVGKIDSIDMRGVDCSISVFSEKMSMADVNIGDSISVNGVCLTVTEHNGLVVGGRFVADVSAETLKKTNLGQKKSGDRVNLEQALMPTDRMGGHIVSGHVDGVGKIVERANDGRSVRFRIEAPQDISHYIAAKGSITINGISLTVNEVESNLFTINIIPQTLSETTLNIARIGDSVNLEIDVIARYLERLLSGKKEKAKDIPIGFLAENGFIR